MYVMKIYLFVSLLIYMVNIINVIYYYYFIYSVGISKPETSIILFIIYLFINSSAISFVFTTVNNKIDISNKFLIFLFMIF